MASCQSAITTGTPDLLDIILNSSWHIKVNDRLDITLIDTHREGNRAAKHTSLVLDELPLDEVALLISLTCVVGSS